MADFPHIRFLEAPLAPCREQWLSDILKQNSAVIDNYLRIAEDLFKGNADITKKKDGSLFNERMRFYRFCARDLDEDTLFSALSDQLFGTPTCHTLVRELIVIQLRKHQRLYEEFVVGSYEDYCNNISRNETRGDDTCIKAAADLFLLKVVILGSHEFSAIMQHIPISRMYKKVIYVGMSYSTMHSIYPRCVGFSPAFKVDFKMYEDITAIDLKRLCDFLHKDLPFLRDPVAHSDRRDERVTMLGFERTVVIGKGDCLYRALSHQLFGSEHNYHDVRYTIFSQLLKHHEKYQHMAGKEYIDYCYNTSLDLSWGDTVSIRAACDAYKVKIIEVCSEPSVIVKEHVNPFEPYKSVLQICTNKVHCDSMTEPRHRRWEPI